MTVRSSRGTITDTASFAKLLLWLVILTADAMAQIRSGTITGTVLDQSGALVPQAEVVVFELATNQKYETKSNGAGEFRVPYLPPGRYRVDVAREGFQKGVRDGINLGAIQTIRVDVRLALAQSANSVQVSAGTTDVDIDSGTVQSATDARLIDALPNVAHNPFAYVGLHAGVTTREAQSNQSNLNSFGVGIYGRRQISQFAINGGYGGENDIQLDGLSVQGAAWNEAAVVPNQDALQEVRVSVNGYSAEYGRGQGVISMTTKGGTNQFHGTGFLRHRNSVLNANTFDNNARGIANPDQKIYTYGATFGGPIKKNKAFFFGSYEGLFYNNPLIFLRTVPTELEKKGDFSRTLANVGGVARPLQLFDPFSARVTASNVYTRLPLPNSIIPRPDPYALNVLSNYPAPNRPPDDQFNTNNFYRSATETLRKNNLNSRVDYRINDQNSLYFTGGFTRSDIVNPLTFADNNYWNSLIGGQFARFISDRNPYLAIGDTWVLSPTWVLDFRVGVNRINAKLASDEFNDGSFDYAKYGIPQDVQNAMPVRAVPIFAAPLNSSWSPLNNNSSLHKRERQTNHVVAGSANKSTGKWNFKFGGELRNQLANLSDAAYAVTIQSPNTFSVQTVNATGGIVGATNAATAGHGAASLLMGTGSLVISRGASVPLALLHQYGALYSQNDWKPTQKLTINFGLRWDWQPSHTERYNRSTSFDANGINPYGGRGVIQFPGAGGNDRRLYPTYWKAFQPRLGFAYRVTGKTVLRGGAGLLYLPSNTGFFGGAFQYGSQSFDSFTNSLPYGSDPAGVPVGTYYQVNKVFAPTNSDASVAQLYGQQGPHFPAGDYKPPRVYQVNFHIDRSFGSGWTAGIGYNGAFARRTQLSYRIPLNSDQFISDAVLASWRTDYIARNGSGNPGTDQVRNPFQPANGPLIPFLGNLGSETMPRNETLWPFPYYKGMGVHNNNGFSSYNALQISTNKQFSNGMMINAFYVWSRSLGVTNGEVQSNLGVEGIPTLIPNARDLNQNKHLSGNDVPHRFVVTYLYELPFGQGRTFAPKSRMLSAVLSSWQASGTYSYQVGVPISPSGASNGSLNGQPNVVAGAPMELPKNLQGWYDGRTPVTLPSGRQITPCAFCYLKYNPDAFTGNLVRVANGSTQQDISWWGNANLAYSALRANPVNTLTLSLRRSFKLSERFGLEFQANATNLLNHTMFGPTSYNMALGNTETRTNPSLGQLPGYGQSGNYGTHSTVAMDPRLVELQVKVRF